MGIGFASFDEVSYMGVVGEKGVFDDVIELLEYLDTHFGDYVINPKEFKVILENSDTLEDAKLYCHENYNEE